MLIVSGAQQAALDADNAYVTAQSEDEWRMFEQATSVPIDVMTGAIHSWTRDVKEGTYPSDQESYGLTDETKVELKSA